MKIVRNHRDELVLRTRTPIAPVVFLGLAVFVVVAFSAAYADGRFVPLGTAALLVVFLVFAAVQLFGFVELVFSRTDQRVTHRIFTLLKWYPKSYDLNELAGANVIIHDPYGPRHDPRRQFDSFYLVFRDPSTGMQTRVMLPKVRSEARRRALADEINMWILQATE
ncbi:MAG: hypothetical protein AAFQ65_02870 [Myxococcota bacterium]